MGIPDRIILTLYTFLMAVFALLMVGLTLSLLPDGPLVAMISSLPGDWRFTIGGVIVFLISIRLLLAGLGVFGGSSILVLSDTENGKTSVSKRALEDYIADIAQEVYGIYRVKVVVTMEDRTTIHANIHACLEPGVNVFETTEEVKDNVKETIKKVTGLDVKNIEVYFKKIKSSGKEQG